MKKETELDKKIVQLNKESEMATRLKIIPGIGDINASILSIAPFEYYEDCRSYA